MVPSTIFTPRPQAVLTCLPCCETQVTPGTRIAKLASLTTYRETEEIKIAPSEKFEHCRHPTPPMVLKFQQIFRTDLREYETTADYIFNVVQLSLQTLRCLSLLCLLYLREIHRS